VKYIQVKRDGEYPVGDWDKTVLPKCGANDYVLVFFAKGQSNRFFHKKIKKSRLYSICFERDSPCIFGNARRAMYGIL